MVYSSSLEADTDSPASTRSSSPLSICSAETVAMEDPRPEFGEDIAKKCLAAFPEFLDHDSKVVSALGTLVDPSEETDLSSLEAKYYAFFEATDHGKPLHLFYQMVTTQRDESLPVVCYAAELYRKAKDFAEALKDVAAKKWVDDDGMMSPDMLCSLMTQAMLVGPLPSEVQNAIIPFLGHDQKPATYTALAEREMRKVGAVALPAVPKLKEDRSNPSTGSSTPSRRAPSPNLGSRPPENSNYLSRDTARTIHDDTALNNSHPSDLPTKSQSTQLKKLNNEGRAYVTTPSEDERQLSPHSDKAPAPNEHHLQRPTSTPVSKSNTYESTNGSGPKNQRPLAHERSLEQDERVAVSKTANYGRDTVSKNSNNENGRNSGFTNQRPPPHERAVGNPQSKPNYLISERPAGYPVTKNSNQVNTKYSGVTNQRPVSHPNQTANRVTTLPNGTPEGQSQQARRGYNPRATSVDNRTPINKNVQPNHDMGSSSSHNNGFVNHNNGGGQNSDNPPNFFFKPNQCHRCLGLNHGQRECNYPPFCPYHETQGHTWVDCKRFPHLARATKNRLNQMRAYHTNNRNPAYNKT